MWLNQDNDNDGDIDYAVDDYEEYDSDQYDSVNCHCNLIHSDRKVTSYRKFKYFIIPSGWEAYKTMFFLIFHWYSLYS